MTLSRRLASVLVAASLAGGGLAWGGNQAEWPVTIDLKARTASGAFSSARNSADSVQNLECNLSAETGNRSVVVSCSARDQNGATAYCVTYDPLMVTVAASLNADDVLAFKWDAYQSCTRLEALKSSALPPKAH